MILQTFPQKQFQGKYCLSPFVMIEVTVSGEVRMCGCGAWMPTTIGNLKETTLVDMLQSELASRIRQSIIDGSYTFCDEKSCGVISNNSLNTIDTLPPEILALLDDATKFIMPHHISFQGDSTCNLSCPSCRTHIIKIPPEQKQQQIELGKILADNLFSVPSNKKIKLETSGAGEVFASQMLMNFINSIDIEKFPNLELDIGTNGLMCEKNWHRISKQHDAINKITVSIDASEADTYEKLRRGGKWPALLDAMNFLKEQKQRYNFLLHTRLIVQQQNYKEMHSFYNLCQTWDVDTVEYSRVTNWGTWTFMEYNFHDVFTSDHPEYALAKIELVKVKQLPNVWFAGL